MADGETLAHVAPGLGCEATALVAVPTARKEPLQQGTRPSSGAVRFASQCQPATTAAWVLRREGIQVARHEPKDQLATPCTLSSARQRVGASLPREYLLNPYRPVKLGTRFSKNARQPS